MLIAGDRGYLNNTTYNQKLLLFLKKMWWKHVPGASRSAPSDLVQYKFTQVKDVSIMEGGNQMKKNAEKIRKLGVFLNNLCFSSSYGSAAEKGQESERRKN